MSYTNVYPSRINWENEPSIASPINATNLNKIDYAVYEHDQTLGTWDTTKANQSDLLLSVKSIDYNTSTGVFVFTWQNGTTKTVDLNIEKIPVSFSMSPQGVITMTTDDGTQYTADVGSLIKTYTFTDSTEIDFTVTTDASGNKTVTAALKDGSIVGTKLEPNYLANCQSAANSASASKTAAKGSAEDSEAWAVGQRDGVDVPSTDPAYHNNSKYWAEHTTSSFAGLTDTDITNPQDGQVPVYNSSTNKWENADQSAGGGSTIKVTTSESSLYGRPVTITCGTYTESKTFSNSGVAEFTGVTATGTFTISTSTSGGTTVTKSLSVPYFGNYSTTITLFSATITATFPADRGATCTCDGVTATTSPYTFTVGSAGTYPVQATLDGASKSVSVNITTDGQSETCNFAYGTINLTFDDEFRGLTITCGLNGTTITKTAPISGNTMAFYPPSTGEWIISATYSGVPYQTSATITSLATPVSASLQQVPDGKTVTPTDDIQKWLACAGITDKTYTTLAEVINDSTTLLALLSNNNASDYLVRSTSFATASGLVPTMTSNTAPSGTVFFTGEVTGANGYLAFNGNGWSDPSNVRWHTNEDMGTSVFLGYDFGKQTKVNRAKIRFAPNVTSATFKIQGSDDNSTYTDLTTAQTATGNSAVDVVFTSIANNRYYKVLITAESGSYSKAGQISALQFYLSTGEAQGLCDNSTAMTDIGANNYCANTLLDDATWCDAICNSTYFESVLNVKVPTMTGDTTPSGECIANSYRSDRQPYKAFDGSDSSIYTSQDGELIENFYLGYVFPSAVKICKVGILASSYDSSYYFDNAVYGGNNISSLTKLSSDMRNQTSSTQLLEDTFVNANTFTNYVIKITGSNRTTANGSNWYNGIYTMQFYGRQDI